MFRNLTYTQTNRSVVTGCDESDWSFRYLDLFRTKKISEKGSLSFSVLRQQRSRYQAVNERKFNSLSGSVGRGFFKGEGCGLQCYKPDKTYRIAKKCTRCILKMIKCIQHI